MGAFDTLEQQITESVKKQVLEEVQEQINSGIAIVDEGYRKTLELLEKKLTTPSGSREVTVNRIDPLTQVISTENLGHVHSRFDEALSMLSVRLAPVLVGPTGSTKTFVTEQLAKALGATNYVVKKLCRATGPHELVGYMTAQGTYVPGAITEVVKNGGLIVLDELDAANENIILLAKDLRGKKFWMPYGMQEVHRDCLVIATMNTWGNGATREYVGRLAQDAALLNEFASLSWEYDKSLEEFIAESEFRAYGGNDVKGLARYINIFWRLRDAAEIAKVKIVFGTRNLKHSAALLTRGYSFEYVLRACVFHGAKQSDVDRIKAALAEPINEEDYKETLHKMEEEKKTTNSELEQTDTIGIGDKPEPETGEEKELSNEIKEMKRRLFEANAENRTDKNDQIPL